MINETQIKKTNDGVRIIFYEDSGISTGFLFNKQSAYDLFDNLRSFFNNLDLKTQEVTNENN
jgi:hypothetical protein